MTRGLTHEVDLALCLGILSTAMTNTGASSRRFDIALSFPGERRIFVEAVAKRLATTLGERRILYDRFHDAEFARVNLDTYLPSLYRTQSELLVVFLCAEYPLKRWCNLEWRFIRQLIATADEGKIMFLSFGNPGDLAEAGILAGDGHVDILSLTPEETAEKILFRLALNRSGPITGVGAAPRLSHTAPILELFGIKWIGGGAVAKTNDGEFPLATILRDPKAHNISTFLGDACAIRFDAQVSDSYAWAVIEEIAVVLNSYRPLPQYEPVYPCPLQDAHVYYVEIDNPLSANGGRFSAGYVFHSDQQERFGVVRLNSGSPEPFVVRINVNTPGIYAFDIRIVARHKDEVQEMVVAKSKTFLFAE